MSGSDFIKIMGNVTGNSAGALYAPIASGARVKYVDTLKTFIDLLGYGVKAEMDGGYPVGYLTQALNLKLISVNFLNNGNSPGAAVSYYDFASVLETCFKLRVLKQVTFGAQSSFEANGDNFLYEIMKMRKIECQQMVSNSVTGKFKYEGVSENHIEIGNEMYKLSGDMYYANKLLGRYVDAYCLCGKDELPPYTIKSIQIAKKSNSTVIDAADIAGFDSYILTYKNGGEKIRTKSIPADAFILYNGMICASFSAATFDFEYGGVVFEYGETGKLGAVIITAYRDYVVSGIEPFYKLLYDKTDFAALCLDTREVPMVFITDAAGNPFEFENIVVGDIVTAAANTKYADVLVSRNILNNTVINGFSTVDDNLYIQLATGDEIQISRLFSSSAKYFKPEPGKAYKISINAFDVVSYIETMPAPALILGYLVDSVMGKGIDADLKMKVFRNDGVMSDMKTGQALTVGLPDASPKKKFTAREFFDLLHDPKITEDGKGRELIWYKQDDNGIITHVDLPLSAPDAGFPDRPHKVGAGLTYNLKISSKILSRASQPQKVMANNAAIFLIPPDEADYDFYRIRYSNYYDTGAPALTFDGYSLDEDSVIINYMVMTGQEEAKYIGIRERTAIVTKVGEALAPDGTKVKRAVGIRDGVRVVWESISAFDDAYVPGKPETRYSVQEGDIIRCRFSSTDRLVDEVQIIWRGNMTNPAYPGGPKGHLLGTTGAYIQSSDPNQSKYSNPYSINSLEYATFATTPEDVNSGAFRVFYGWVYKKFSNVLMVTTQNLSDNEFKTGITPEHVTELLNVSTMGRFSVVNLNGQTITAKQGVIDDIRPYSDTGSSCSRVISIQFWGEPTQMIILNGEQR
jgi:hypothetical protein